MTEASDNVSWNYSPLWKSGVEMKSDETVVATDQPDWLGIVLFAFVIVVAVGLMVSDICDAYVASHTPADVRIHKDSIRAEIIKTCITQNISDGKCTTLLSRLEN